MDNRHADLLKQGFMKPAKSQRKPKQKPFDEDAWKRANVEAARKRYAELFADDGE